MIDSHCHLDHEPLLSNLDEVIKRSKNVGINKILTICTTISSFEKIKKIVTKDEIIFQTYLREISMFSFEVNRKNGQGSIKDFDYPPIKEKESELWIQMAHSVLRYPDLSDKDRRLFSIRDYVGKTFTPSSMSKLDCSKLEKSF